MVKRQSYRLLRLVCLSRSSSYWYAPHLERPQFNDLVIECKEILAGIGKILDNMAVEDLEPELEVDVEPEPGPEVIAESVSL